jgi:Asp-tRNA(Asn)/Glu-tRNA(Gln) amidotransferase A subunit family amidase
VAARLVPAAIGTQTAGSVLRPASFCGVVGFKPTHGLVPMDGVLPQAPSLDTFGLFVRDLEAVPLLLAVAAGGPLATPAPVAPLRLALCRVHCRPGVLTLLRARTVDQLRQSRLRRPQVGSTLFETLMLNLTAYNAKINSFLCPSDPSTAFTFTNAGRLNYGASTAGTPSHLIMEMFKSAAGLDIVGPDGNFINQFGAASNTVSFPQRTTVASPQPHNNRVTA